MSIKKEGSKYFFVATNAEVKNKETLEYIKNLRIPPAYNNIIINDKSNKILAYGYDKKGRKQVMYNKQFIEHNKKERFEKILEMKDTFTKIYEHCQKIVATFKITTESKICLIILLLIDCNFRIGNDKYLKLYKSYGISNIEWRHVKFNKKEKNIEIKFIGKKGVENMSICTDERSYKFMIKLYKNAKKDPEFKNTDSVFNISAFQVNDYISKFGDITCKDLRTFRANYLFIEYFMKEDKNLEIDKRKNNALKKVAEELHNTPVVCKNNYIMPHIFNMFDK